MEGTLPIVIGKNIKESDRPSEILDVLLALLKEQQIESALYFRET